MKSNKEKNMKKLRIFAIALTIVIMVSMLAACAKPTVAPTAAPTEAPVVTAAPTEAPTAAPVKTTDNTDEMYSKVTIAINQDPGDLKPFGVNFGAKPYIYQNFYESLFDLVDNDYEPVLAKGFKVVDDMHYDVQLNDNIYDSAGNHITASDVVFSTQKLVEAGFNFKWYMVGDIVAKDDFTVEYTWTKPITDVGELEFPWCRTVIFSQKAYEASPDQFATAPVATGPYIVKEFTSGSKVVLEVNPKYWQTDKSLISLRHQTHVKTIEYDIIAESAQNVIALETGAVDYSEAVPAENFAEFQAGGKYADKFNAEVASGSFVYALNLNQSEGNIGADLNFRLAVYYAINNDAIATALQDTIVPAKAFGTPHFASEYQAAWDTTPNYVNTFDPEKAKQLIAQTAYKGEKLILATMQDENSQKMATVIQSFLLNVGINTDIKVLDQAASQTIDTDAKGYDIKIFGMGGGSLIGEWNRVMNNHELGKDYSVGFVKDPQLQTLFETANAIKTHTPENLTALENYVLEKGYFYAIGSPRINMVYSKNITKVVMRESEFLLPGACTYILP
jgi:peptide/nickel transport system substrate-binding protein